MEKQQRRAYFNKKVHHQKKEKQNRKQEVEINQSLKDKIKSFDLKGIIDFMNSDYQALIQKAPQIENIVNGQLIKRIQQFKTAWKTYHQQRLLDFLKKNGIPFPSDPQLSFRENLWQIYKKDCYYLNQQNLIRANHSKEPLRFIRICLTNQTHKNNRFYIEETLPEIDFRIEFKRIKKDVIFACQGLQELVRDVENVLQEKWEPKL